MPATKRLMAPGSFQLNLREDTPVTITDHLTIGTQGFGHVIVTPAAVPSHVLDTAANLLPLSIFTGVMREQESRTSFSGAHASVLLGDEDGKGQLPEVDVTQTKTIANWLTDHLKPASVLSTGSYSASASTLNWTWKAGQSRRDAIDYVCDYFGMEWVVQDDLTLDADTAANLYGSPSVVLTPWMDGQDILYTGIEADMTLLETVEDFTTRVFLKEDDGTYEGATIGSNPFQDQLGADYVWKRYVDGSSTVVAGTGATVASQQLGRFDQVDQKLTVRSKQRALMDKIACGARVYAWHPDKNIYDVTTEIYFRGRLIRPMTLRVQAITMPFEMPMGVYFRKNGSSPAVIDLTPYVDWESPGATLEVGAPIRSLASAVQLRGVRGRTEGGFKS